MRVTELGLAGLRLIDPDVVREPNGEFTYFLDERRFREQALTLGGVQEHGSFYPLRWTVRGLHAQRPPRVQTKLVRVARGRILDVAVDVRRGSHTWGRHAAVELSAANRRMLEVPPGFVHGFCTLEPDTEVVFRLTDYNDRAFQTGVRWNDPTLGIEWPCGDAPAWVFPFDRDLPRLQDYDTPFTEDTSI